MKIELTFTKDKENDRVYDKKKATISVTIYGEGDSILLSELLGEVQWDLIKVARLAEKEVITK